jgi:hypothetical protein
MKIKPLAISALVTAALAVAAPANAASYSYDFVGTGYEVTGLVTATDTLNALGGYDILGISGFVTGLGGGVISGLVGNPAQPDATNNGLFIYDNVGFFGTPHVNHNGVLFQTSNGATWNLYSNSATDYELYAYESSVGPSVDVHGTLTVTAVPEPETYAMMLAGLGLVGFMARRRKI